ncbi:MAG: DUF5320 domain-containing protein [Candidatus Omnitrophica bacterium]|nr:DUF5320 domain-containing protein [Candidatus Omnitrophota bacterium]
MPGFDGTGPMGQGGMTGGGRGYCAVNLNGTGARQGVERGFFRRDGGRGHRNCFYATGFSGWMRAQRGMQAFGGFGRIGLKENELAIFKDQADYLKDELEAVQARVQDLEGKQEAGK